MSNTHSLSAAQQQAIISTATVAASSFANLFTNKLGNKHFFSQQDIEDIAGNAVLYACRSLEHYDPSRAKLTTWVSRIAVNCVKDAIDYKMKRLPISVSMEAVNDDNGDEYNVTECYNRSHSFHPEMQELVSEYGADRHLEQREFESNVWQEVGKLSDMGQRYVYMLTDGYTPKEMAAIDCCRPNTAAKRVYDVRHALKSALSELALEFDLRYCCATC